MTGPRATVVSVGVCLVAVKLPPPFWLSETFSVQAVRLALAIRSTWMPRIVVLLGNV
jgi:hypothetical protein